MVVFRTGRSNGTILLQLPVHFRAISSIPGTKLQIRIYPWSSLADCKQVPLTDGCYFSIKLAHFAPGLIPTRTQWLVDHYLLRNRFTCHYCCCGQTEKREKIGAVRRPMHPTEVFWWPRPFGSGAGDESQNRQFTKMYIKLCRGRVGLIVGCLAERKNPAPPRMTEFYTICQPVF